MYYGLINVEMKTIIPPVDKRLLEKELNPDRFLKKTNNGNNEIYLVSEMDSPNVVREIGRLREVTFRDAGGGTGEELDLDSFDKGEYAFKQLVLWDPNDKELIGGYRLIYLKIYRYQNILQI